MSGYFQRLAQRGSGAAGGLQLVRPVPALYRRAAEPTGGADEGLETTDSAAAGPAERNVSAAPASTPPALRSAASAEAPASAARAEGRPGEAVQKAKPPAAEPLRTEVQRIEVQRGIQPEAAAAAPSAPAAQTVRGAEPAQPEATEQVVPAKPTVPTLESLFDAIDRPPSPSPERLVSWPASTSQPAALSAAPELPSVSIGRINITVAPPPVPQYTGTARTQGFRAYHALRRGLAR